MYRDFPVKISRSERFKYGPVFGSHWHEEFQILYFEQGEALIHCNSHPYKLKPGNLMIINSNEIHYGETLCQHLVYYIIKVDLNFLLSSHIDFCQTNYITPLLQGLIRFQNHITHNDQLSDHIQQIVKEYRQQKTGCELAIKAHLYNILVLLLRHYQQELFKKTMHDRQQKNMHQLRTVLQYVDQHYNENITLNQLANLSNMSSQHFCRVFKNTTGKRPMDYINYLRINKAVTLLSTSDFNISEIAMAVGFDDSNYFSRLFKKYQNISPSAMRK
ncbi:AraC family transcriptional regulator [Pelosinus sp. sgz500959]|uniref:AraC family transcriptional regulator n=1 Tax=Pelosinus sp. sgz500959 TaxID=3242472 RepID=UPI00366CA5C5